MPLPAVRRRRKSPDSYDTASEYDDRRPGATDDRRPAHSPAACAPAPGSPASPAPGTPDAADPRSRSAATRAAASAQRQAAQPCRHSPPHHHAVRRSAATRALLSSAPGSTARTRPRRHRPPGPAAPPGRLHRRATRSVKPPYTAAATLSGCPSSSFAIREQPLPIDRLTGQPVRRREAADDRGRRRPESTSVRNPVLTPQREAGHRDTERFEPGPDRPHHEMRLVQRYVVRPATGHLDGHPGSARGDDQLVVQGQGEAEGVEAGTEVRARRRNPDPNLVTPTITHLRRDRRRARRRRCRPVSPGTRRPWRGRARCRCPSGRGR